MLRTEPSRFPPLRMRYQNVSRLVVGMAVLAALAASCTRPPEEPTPAGGGVAEAEDALPPPSVPPAGATSAPPTQDCQNGWMTPEQGSQEYERPLRIIGRTLGVEPRFEVVEMRYFVGPESPPSAKNFLQEIRRWYVKGFLRSDDAIRGRWLVESRRFGAGVAAVAPYDTRGYRSPDWTAFKYETVGPYAEPRAYAGLPGEWVGTPYDFVTGDEPADNPGEALTIPGLPDQVVGCLSGT